MYALVSTMAIPSMAASFKVQPLPNEVKFRMIEIGIRKPGCPVDIDRLRLVQFTHYDFFDQQ